MMVLKPNPAYEITDFVTQEKRQYILYDGRACHGLGTEEASVLVACDSDKEAHSFEGDYGAMACYSYQIQQPAVPGQPEELVDEKFEWNWFPKRNH